MKRASESFGKKIIDLSYEWLNIILVNKSKTTKPAKKPYSSVKELLEDNNSKIKLTPFNCKEVKFGKRISLNDPHGFNGKFDVIFKRASTSQKFFEGIENQLPNQILWNEEEQQAYFLNSDKQLYKILFEPFIMKKKNTTQIYIDIVLKEKHKMEIEELAIPWSSWNVDGYAAFGTFNHLLTSMFLELLNLVKEKKIKISCGVIMMDFLNSYSRYNSYNKKIEIAGCEIIPELDFNIGKYDLAYDNIILVGQNIKSKIDNTQAVNEAPPSPKKTIWQRIFG